LPVLGGESRLELISRGIVVVVIDRPSGSIGSTGVQVEGEHSNVLKISLVERKLIQEISIEAAVVGDQIHIGVGVVVGSILSGSVEGGEISGERTSGGSEGRRNISSSGDDQGIQLSSDITVGEITGVNLEIALAGDTLQIADGCQINRSVDQGVCIEGGVE